MKTSSAPAPGRTPSRRTALHCVLINQLATPGLGSVIARRFVAGIGQLLLACGGFALVVVWFAQRFADFSRQWQNLPPAPKAYPWAGKVGALLFLAAWLWAWVTSVAILRGARNAKPPVLPTDPGGAR
ncbi:MAG: hypothetical protein HZA89_15340 [Verrucomicrobia bacterium]|nr:hypothetical protein [Verrucomicrobiota bacterium]